MASSSKPPKQDAEETDWLELGLGLEFSSNFKKSKVQNGSNPSSSSCFSLQRSQTRKGSEKKLRLGLGLGFDNISERNKDHDHVYHHDHPGMALGLTSPSSYVLFGSPLLSPWPLHGDSSGSFGVCKDTHNYPVKFKPGLWFRLSPFLNRDGEAQLPQIQKAYIRVKDDNVTVFTVKTYLVTKLGLSNEAEVDISCVGKKLLHSQTLKNVRDSIWLPRLMIESVNSRATSTEILDGSSVNHLMSLEYGRQFHLN